MKKISRKETQYIIEVLFCSLYTHEIAFYLFYLLLYIVNFSDVRQFAFNELVSTPIGEINFVSLLFNSIWIVLHNISHVVLVTYRLKQAPIN